jgi:DNA-cytosine methyltransferase
MLTTLDLFAGIGGFALGLEATDFFRTTCFVENEPYCQAVLQYHWPEVPVLGDIKNVQRCDLPDPNPDVIVGGFPCQPFSHAGKQRAQDDPRHLWPEMFRLIRECRPTWVIGENVAGIIKLGLDEVLSDLESEGYATRTFNIPACAVGAPHIRQRLWIVAHADSQGEPDGAFDGDTRQGQLGFGWSETSSHGSDADESGSHRAAEHQQDPKHGQTQLRDKQVGEFGQMGKDVADAEREGDGRGRLSGSRKDKSENGQRPSNQFVRCSKVVADADSDDRGRERCTKPQAGTTRVEHGGSGSRQLERGIDADVADAASIDGQRSIGQGGCTRESEAAFGDGGGVVADTDSERPQRKWADCGEEGRQDQERQAGLCSGTILADAERPRTRMEKSRDSGQGRKSADTRQSKVLRQEDGACSSEGLAASGDRPEVWWKVEPPVGRVVDGLPNRVPQLRALGNSIIPQIAQEIGNAIKVTYDIKTG